MNDANDNPDDRMTTAPEILPPATGAAPRVAGPGQGLLPGMAMISMYLLLLSMMNAFAAMRGAFGNGAAKYSLLGVCTLLVVGVFGLLRLRRWGWSLVTGGCLIMAVGYFYGFHRTHIPPYVINGLFALVFFLYLSRTEVRERLR
jgi:hypothetical protein